jgi:SAM-dependent methyltransferase
MSQTDRFTGRADAYVVGRPTYPPIAIDTLLAGLGDPQTLVVADLGAGTGISARAVAERGPRVIALEPNAAMRAKAEAHERISWVDGTAEATTLGEAAVDVAAAFQAWHWFDHDAAVCELRRVVRPGGRIALLAYERDENDDFTRAFGDIFRQHSLEPIEKLRADALARFTAIPGARRTEYVNAQKLDRPGVHARLASSSYLPHEGEPQRAMLADADALFDRYSREEVVQIRLVTYLVIADV